jgi:hypothetical protein
METDMRHFRRGVVAALVVWVVGMSVAAAVKQAHADQTPARAGATTETKALASVSEQVGSR